MTVPEAAIERMRARIDAYAKTGLRYGVAAARGDGGGGVPPDMQEGETDPDGWVGWRVLPSRVALADVEALERRTGARFPMPWKAYLLARAHLFDQLHARGGKQLVFWTATPTREPLRGARRLLEAWAPLVRAGYVPFAQWGDGWGPMCFDVDGLGDELVDAPVVWLDHEVVPHDAAKLADRRTIAPLAQPLYPTIEAMFDDVLPLPRE